jgi:hypothetical protein
MLWAKFQPRSATPQTEPGQLYYPSVATHIVEKYWAYLNDLLSHPDCKETQFTKGAMAQYAAALSPMNLASFEPLVDADASDKHCRISQVAVLSRRKPIQDAQDCWEPRGECAAEPGSQTCSIVGTDLAPRLGSTDTCVAQGNPSYT